MRFATKVLRVGDLMILRRTLLEYVARYGQAAKFAVQTIMRFYFPDRSDLIDLAGKAFDGTHRFAHDSIALDAHLATLAQAEKLSALQQLLTILDQQQGDVLKRLTALEDIPEQASKLLAITSRSEATLTEIRALLLAVRPRLEPAAAPARSGHWNDDEEGLRKYRDPRFHPRSVPLWERDPITLAVARFQDAVMDAACSVQERRQPIKTHPYQGLPDTAIDLIAACGEAWVQTIRAELREALRICQPKDGTFPLHMINRSKSPYSPLIEGILRNPGQIGIEHRGYSRFKYRGHVLSLNQP
ncbi:MAG: hypothetical protein ACKVP3_12515 [Hyphomicrobiaceae bacterium]